MIFIYEHTVLTIYYVFLSKKKGSSVLVSLSSKKEEVLVRWDTLFSFFLQYLISHQFTNFIVSSLGLTSHRTDRGRSRVGETIPVLR